MHFVSRRSLFFVIERGHIMSLFIARYKGLAVHVAAPANVVMIMVELLMLLAL